MFGFPRDFQLRLFGGVITTEPVNVASVPQRSPFKYPKGKTWLVPIIRQWLIGLPERPKEFIEPFAGGAIVGLNVAFDRLAKHIILVELDDQIAAVWKTILCGDYEWLANRIVTFDLTVENVEAELSNDARSLEEKAFQTILKNRTNRGGIIAPGAGRIKYGENGKGIRSRWYPETLRRRILDIAKIKDMISFIEGDGLMVMKQYAGQADAVYFIEPPYTAAGKKAGSRLYTYSDLDHEELFSLSGDLTGEFLMTYDNAEGVKQLAEKHDMKYELIAMKNTHHNKMMELLISKDLGWLIK